jgi:DNA-binding transcriptional LysR family regulator
VSRRIAEIETVIGLPIIRRESRGISITAAGEIVLRHAKAVVASLESLGAELSRLSSGAKGSVRIAANLSAIVQFLPEDIAAFKQMYPDVDIQVDERTSADVQRCIAESQADIGICNAGGCLDDMQSHPYQTDHLMLVLPRGHRLGQADSVRFSDIAAESFVGLGSETALMRLLAKQALELGVKLNIKIQVSSLDALCRMVHAQLGIAVVPQQVAELHAAALNLQLVPILEPWAMRKLIVVYPSRERLTATAAALVDYLTGKP